MAQVQEENIDAMDLLEIFPVGMNRQNPDEEGVYLQEEYLFQDVSKPFGRVLSFFEFRLNGEPVVVDANGILPDGSSDMEVVGMIGTLYGKEGLFGQCGWFGNYDLDWFWKGEYAMLLPHKTYRDMWEETLYDLGPGALSAMFKQWPAQGAQPPWWPDRWKDDWPFEQEVGSKQRASTDVQEHELLSRQAEMPGDSWLLIGARSEQENQGQMLTNLDHRSGWLLEPSGDTTLPSGGITKSDPDPPHNTSCAKTRLGRRLRKL
ncbi:hypothetical protein RhiXN_01250 [Rhizoctonia solani]|uniref:Uncharacterized protein n=1 Tax=Rhizoctonia solani TaxID=456999 RepID=A0A8H8P8Q4_9AGAM|nr:uncharacterized protein RhiXN_01250 [Rhizoctonia solani]QRW26655.1 hypothetical protein RhiXN_01250 [Rhizoctonia solani]